MIVDASALLAILRNEPEATLCAEALENSYESSISSANWLEASIVVDSKRDPIVSRRFDELVRVAGLRMEPVSERHVHIARQAYRDFGKGSGHPAQLNIGDCFAYALAKDRNEPLLFTGKNFSRTDLESAF